MRWLAAGSVRSRGVVLALAVVLAVLGVSQLRTMPVDVLPEFVPPTVQIQTEALGLSAAEVEQLITVPLEQDLLNGVAWLKTIRSQSVPGLSSVELVFEPGTDLLNARQLVQEKLTQAAGLPNVSKPPQMLPAVSSTSRVMMIGLSSRSLSLIDLSVLARWTVRPRLLGVPGVANVAIWGQRERQLQVQVDPNRLAGAGVSLAQVVKSTGNALWVSPLTFLEASTPGTGGFIDTPTQRLGIQHNQPIGTPQDLAKVTVDEVTGPPLRLGDVSTVVEDHQPLIGDAVLREGQGLLLVIEKFPDANALAVSHGIDDALDALNTGMPDVSVDRGVYRPADYIHRSLDTVRVAAIAGLVLLVIALFVLLLEWRAVVVAVVGIALALLVGAVVLHLRGATMNPMVIAGLSAAVALLVHDAVTGLVAARRRLGDGEDRLRSVIDATLEARAPLAYGTAIALLAAVPLVVLRGEGDAFLRPVAVSYAGAVVAGAVVALTVVPALAALFLPAGIERGRPAGAWLERRYAQLLHRLVRSPLPAAAVLVVLTVAGIVALPLLDRGPSILPTFRDTDVLVSLRAPAGTSIGEMDRITARMSNDLRRVAGVGSVGAHVGRAVAADQVVSANAGEIWLRMARSADHGRTLASVERVVAGYPGLRRDVSTYPEQRVRAVLGQETDDLTVRVYGQDLAVLRDKAEEIRRLVGNVRGVKAGRVQGRSEEATIEVSVDLAAAQRAGVSPGDVRRIATTLISGVQVGNLFEEQKVFDVVVWGVPGARESLTGVRNLLIDTPTGGHVRLGDLATVAITPQPAVIRHESVSRSLDVGLTVRGRRADAVARDVRSRLASVRFPLEHHAEVVGDYAAKRDAHTRLVGSLAAVVIGMLLLLQAAFGSWRLGVAVLVALPAALAGGVLGALVAGGTVTVGTVAGIVAVLGVAVRGSVLLVRRCGRLEDVDGVAFSPELVTQAAVSHAVPMVATAVAAALALTPALVLGDRAGLEVLRPLAAVVIGGLLSTAVVELFVLPALYLRFGAHRDTELASTHDALEGWKRGTVDVAH
jgi:Cu/Ag efflux pump CusA